MRKSIRNSNIVVCAIVRDVEKTLIKDLKIIDNSLLDFKNVAFCIVESDSKDKTIENLDFCKKKFNNFYHISLGNKDNSFKHRTERLAYCRNQYLKYLDKFNLFDIDFVAIVDLDGVNNLLTKESIESSWTSKENWDVICANQKYQYYDLYALRHDFINPFNHLNAISETKEFLGIEQSNLIFHQSKLLNIPQKDKLIPVNSAFGGFSIYSINSIKGIKYFGLDQSGRPICEHVTFNSQLKKNNFKIYINPQMINTDYTIHTPKKTLIRKIIGFNIKNRIKRLFKKL